MAARIMPQLIDDQTIQARLNCERVVLNQLVDIGVLSFYDIQEVTDPQKRFVHYKHVDVYFEQNDVWFLRFLSSEQWYPTLQPPTVEVIRYDGAPAPRVCELFDSMSALKMHDTMTHTGGWATMCIAEFVRILLGLSEE